jgi:hypothetical protein
VSITEPHRRFHAEKSLVATDSRVIDQHVEGPERPLYLVDYVLRPLKIPHIGLKRERSVSTFAQTPRKRLRGIAIFPICERH